MASARWRIVLDAIASSVTMQPFLSRALVKKGHIVTFARSTVGCAGQWQRLGTAIAKMHANHGQLLRKDGSQSAVALGVCHGSLAHRGWHSSSTVVGAPQLRPPASLLHNAAFCKVLASRYAKAALGVAHRWRALSGFQNRRYAKLPSLERSPVVGASRSLARPTRRRLSP